MKVSIDKNEVLRYLGYKNQPLDENINKLIDACISKTINLSSPKYIYKYFDFTAGGASDVLAGSDIKKHLEGCSRFILMAVTLGTAVDAAIRTAEIKHLSEAVILDCCAAAAVEDVCDSVCGILTEENKNMFLTTRFSPGYGDMPISVQPQLIHLLDAPRKIGLTVTNTDILIPRKSVTAVVGVSHTKREIKKGCEFCSMKENCSYRKQGNCCER